MANNKLEYYSDLADKQARQLTSSYSDWIGFLETAGRIYKYPFNEQVLIYAQRPDAVACAAYEIWNKPMNRYVKRGSKGIALIDDTGIRPYLKYVFDYSDTAPGRENAKRPFFWEVNENNKDEIINYLKKIDDVSEDNLENVISDLANGLAARYYNDNISDILNSVEGNRLEETGENNIRETFQNALSASLKYCVMKRCNLDAEPYLTEKDFEPILNFNSASSIYALGSAVSELSEQILRDIEITVKRYERNKSAERSEQDYGNDLSAERGLSDTEYNSERSNGGHREVRNDEEELSERTQEDNIQHSVSSGEAVSASFGDRQSGGQPIGTDDERNDGTISAARQGNESNSLDGTHELSESGSGRSDNQGTDIQLNDNRITNSDEEHFNDEDKYGQPIFQSIVIKVFPTEKEQQESIAERELSETSASVEITQEDIDNALINWNGNAESRNAVYNYMIENGRSKEAAVFLRNEYGGDLPDFTVEKDGAESVKLTWAKVQLRIGQLIADGHFTIENEQIIDDISADKVEQSDNEVTSNTEIENFVDETVSNVEIVKSDIIIKPNNFHITDDDLGVGGAKTKYKNNVEAIKTLKAVESENRLQRPKNKKFYHVLSAGEDFLKSLTVKTKAGAVNTAN